MKITRAIIKNFRALQYIDCELNQFSVIIGENDAGKTSFFYAINAFFAPKKLTDKEDWHKNNTDENIQITLTLADFPEETRNKYEKSLSPDGTLTIEGTCVFGEAFEYVAVCGAERTEIKKTDMKKYFSANNIVFMPVKRGVDNQFSMLKTAMLGKILRAQMAKMLEQEESKDVQNAMGIVQGAMLDSIREIQNGIESFLREQLGNDSIKLRFDDFELDPVEGINVKPTISDERSDNIIVQNRGAGTQNNIILALFRYIAESEVKKDFIFLVEEPENSLHPKAQRNLLNVIREIGKETQVLVTTHSPVFVDRTRYENNILFTMQPQGNTRARIFNKDSLAEVRDDLGIKVSDVLLKGGGNCALLVEGDTEEEAMPIFMEMSGNNEFNLGITIINIGGSDAIKTSTIVLLLQSYEIPCVVMLDKDAEKHKKALECKEELQRRKKMKKMPYLRQVFCLKKGTIEDYYPRDIVAKLLCENGAKGISESDIPENGGVYEKIEEIYNNQRESPLFFKKVLGSEGTKLMQKRGCPVPDDIQEVIDKVKEVALSYNSKENPENSEN